MIWLLQLLEESNKKDNYMKYILLNIAVFLLLVSFNCSPTSPTPIKDVELTVSDVSCTEAWLHLTVNNLSRNTQVQLVRNSNIVNTFDINSSDTTIYDDSLSSNKTYSYQVVELQNGMTAAKSEIIAAKTMDTTSSNFTWQTYILGDGNSSTINDVAIVNDTLAYAVGAIYYKDSTEQFDPLPYNLIVWDGKNWSLKKATVNFRGSKVTSSIEGIFIFSNTDIWLMATDPILGDGINWIDYDIRNIIGNNSITISKCWGKNNNNIFFIGNLGNIVHYYNDTWQKIESGTTLNITDVYGSPNSSDIYASLYNTSSSLAGHDLLKITNNNRVYNLTTPNNLYEASSLWVDNKDILFIVGSGLFRKAYGNWKEINEFKMKSLTGIKANGLNDIFVIGSTRSGHFNGKTWTIYNGLNFTSGLYYSIDFKNNMVIIAGYYGTRAIITVGIR